ncbi:MAG TPA: SpoIIE family protein phosphatase [Holophagaceae bacterium]|jgi:sigma-B regulation protein RsbU (phosphoserine phosphatase)|nr:SpoIIE family protein phosphatase [Holophagaceae bacterium]
MAGVVIQVPGKGRCVLDVAHPEITVGRGAGNILVLEDGMLSRHHARCFLKGDGAWIEDLGSRHGTFLNGRRVEEASALQEGDRLLLGRTEMRVLPPDQDLTKPSGALLVDDNLHPQMTLARPVSELFTEASDAGRWSEALTFIHEASLDLLKEVDTGAMLDRMAARLHAFLHPQRVAILLRQPDGELGLAAYAGRPQTEAFRISRHLADTVMERREAVLLRDPALDAGFQSASMVISQISSAIVTPLALDDQVEGLLYVDARVPRDPFTEDDLRLVSSLAHMAAAKLQQARLLSEVARKRQMEEELSLARRIQERLMPLLPPELPGFEIASLHEPSRQVSGDLYGHFPGPDGSAWLWVADVSGKGLGPGLLMATMQAYLDAWADSSSEPGPLADRLSRTLARHTTRNRFITAFLLRAVADGTVHYCNAGHNPGLLRRADGRTEQLESQGMPLALFPEQAHGEARLELAPGDLLAIFTDGITEAAPLDGEDFDLTGLQAVLDRHAKAPLPELIARIHEALAEHTQGVPAADDRTLLLVRRR